MLNIKARTYQIFKIALPVALQNLITYFMVSTDMAFIGQYQIEGLSAIGTVRSPYFTVMSVFFSIAQGLTIYVAQSLGAKRPRKARTFVESAFFFNTLISWCLFVFWLAAGKPIFYALGARGTVLDLAWQYLFYLNFIFIFNGCGVTSNAAYEGMGITVPILITSVVRSLLNILLDWIMIFGRFGFPELGIRGAAIATTISELVGTILLTAMLFNGGRMHLHLQNILKPKIRYYWKIVKMGIPLGIEGLLWSGGMLLISAMLNYLGPLELGFYSILDVILLFAVFIYIGFGIASLSLVGKATGARDDAEALATAKTCVLYAFIVCILVGVLLLLFPRALVTLFMKEKEQIDKVAPLLLLLIPLQFPKAFNIVGANAIRGRGDVKFLMYNQIAGTVLVVILAYIVLFPLHGGLGGLILIILFDETWRALLNTWRLFSYYRRRRTL